MSAPALAFMFPTLMAVPIFAPATINTLPPVPVPEPLESIVSDEGTEIVPEDAPVPANAIMTTWPPEAVPEDELMAVIGAVPPLPPVKLIKPPVSEPLPAFVDCAMVTEVEVLAVIRDGGLHSEVPVRVMLLTARTI